MRYYLATNSGDFVSDTGALTHSLTDAAVYGSRKSADDAAVVSIHHPHIVSRKTALVMYYTNRVVHSPEYAADAESWLPLIVEQASDSLEMKARDGRIIEVMRDRLWSLFSELDNKKSVTIQFFGVWHVLDVT